MKHYILLEFLKKTNKKPGVMACTLSLYLGGGDRQNRGFKVVPGYTVSLGSARAPGDPVSKNKTIGLER